MHTHNTRELNLAMLLKLEMFGSSINSKMYKSVVLVPFLPL